MLLLLFFFLIFFSFLLWTKLLLKLNLCNYTNRTLLVLFFFCFIFYFCFCHYEYTSEALVQPGVNFLLTFLPLVNFCTFIAAAGGSGGTETQRGARWLWNHFLHDADNDDVPDCLQAERCACWVSHTATATLLPTSLSDWLSERPPRSSSSRRIQR